MLSLAIVVAKCYEDVAHGFLLISQTGLVAGRSSADRVE